MDVGSSSMCLEHSRAGQSYAHPAKPGPVGPGNIRVHHAWSLAPTNISYCTHVAHKPTGIQNWTPNPCVIGTCIYYIILNKVVNTYYLFHPLSQRKKTST